MEKIKEKDYYLYIKEVLIQHEKGKKPSQIAEWTGLPKDEVIRIINNNNYQK